MSETKQPEVKLNLYQKIQAVSNEIRNIEKNLSVGKGNYAYKAVGDLDVVLAVKDAETKFKLISIPLRQELISSEVVKTINEDNKEKLTFVDNIKMTIRIQDLESPEHIEIESFGKGIDTGDKGFGKASTYARKYGLLNAYKIATGQDPDAEKSKETETAKTPNDKKVAVENYLNLNTKVLQEILKHFNVGTLDDLTEKQVETIYKSYKQKNLI